MEDIDIERLKKDLENELMGAFVGGGFGGALVEVSDLSRMSLEDLITIAEELGINIEDYL